ncbi:MAG: hypothetical protein ACXACG_17975 [Candidatus Thorarchaeota archaeon]|jgi:hypothetical protein
MIRNLLILDKNGRTLLCSNFGECHSLCDNTEEISGFINALSSFGRALSADVLNEVTLSGLRFMLMPKEDLIFSISADDDDTEEHKVILTQIIGLFADIYDSFSCGIEEEIDTIVYQDFPKFLVDQGILKLNCGKYVECEGCPNGENSLPLRAMTTELDSQREI